MDAELYRALTEGRDYGTVSGTIRAICAECDRQGLSLPTQKAYVLATVDHETNGTFRPVTEAYFLKNPLQYLRKLRYAPYWGRGYVQLTWRDNYRFYGELLGIDLAKEPDRAADPAIACFILVHGMRTGAFTGRALPDYVHRGRTDYYNARRVVNRLDKAAEIARKAWRYLKEMA